MKIVLEAQHACTSEPRGIPVYTIQLIRHLLKRGKFDYSLTFFDKGKERNNRQYIEKHFGEFGVPTFECNTESYKTLAMDASVYDTITYNELTGSTGDIYHFTHFCPIALNLKGKMVVTVHDMLPFMFPELFQNRTEGLKFWWNKLLELEPTIISVSEITKQDIIQFSGYKNIFVVPSGYDETQFFPQQDAHVLEDLKIQPPYLFYCGALDMRKNIFGILDAYSDAAKDFPDLKLVLAGAPAANAEPILQRLHEFESNPSIILPGYITNYQKQVLMSSASAFLFPSFYEGFGLPILEAMACGCPVITSNLSSMPEVAGNAAILINPYNMSELCDAVKQVLASEKLRVSLRQRGYERIKTFSWDKTAEQVEKIYSSLI